VSAGGTADAGQTLTFKVTNDNNGLFSVQPAVRAADGVLSFALKASANGVANVDVYLQDNGGTANGGSDTSQHAQFKITVTAVDDVQAGPTYTVNSTAWTTDGLCAESSCTLREALATANNDGVDSTIELSPGPLTRSRGLTIPNHRSPPRRVPMACRESGLRSRSTATARRSPATPPPPMLACSTWTCTGS
jgi:CSLREA domain-containing protein